MGAQLTLIFMPRRSLGLPLKLMRTRRSSGRVQSWTRPSTSKSGWIARGRGGGGGQVLASGRADRLLRRKPVTMKEGKEEEED